VIRQLTEDENDLKQNSKHQDSLTDISRRQHTNRGLTSVSDYCFEFFCSLTEMILNEFSGEINYWTVQDYFNNLQNAWAPIPI